MSPLCYQKRALPHGYHMGTSMKELFSMFLWDKSLFPVVIRLSLLSAAYRNRYSQS